MTARVVAQHVRVRMESSYSHQHQRCCVERWRGEGAGTTHTEHAFVHIILEQIFKALYGLGLEQLKCESFSCSLNVCVDSQCSKCIWTYCFFSCLVTV